MDWRYCMTENKLCVFVMHWIVILLFSQAAFSDVIVEGERMFPVLGDEGMVATSHYIASESAQKVLNDGGNAIDAAVTAAFVLAVAL